MRKAALALPDGRVLTGDDHFFAAMQAGLTEGGYLSDEFFRLLDRGEIVEGFLGHDAKFYTRAQAAAVAGIDLDFALSEYLVSEGVEPLLARG